MLTFDYPHRKAFDAAKAHARAEFPKESCGLIIDGEYVPCTNAAEDPTKDFFIAPQEMQRYLSSNIEMIVHSHPGGPYFPSKADMEGQARSAVPWAIIVLDAERIADTPVIWGTEVPLLPILGRPFVHGVADCYSLVRDTFRLGKDKLAEQGIEWPYEPIDLYDLPRDDNWWTLGDNFYVDHYAKQGFREIPMEEARPGDAFLIKIRSSICNHAGVLIGGDQIIHHLPMRMSRREPAGIWGRAAEMWLRYEGNA